MASRSRRDSVEDAAAVVVDDDGVMAVVFLDVECVDSSSLSESEEVDKDSSSSLLLSLLPASLLSPPFLSGETAATGSLERSSPSISSNFAPVAIFVVANKLHCFCTIMEKLYFKVRLLLSLHTYNKL